MNTFIYTVAANNRTEHIFLDNRNRIQCRKKSEELDSTLVSVLLHAIPVAGVKTHSFLFYVTALLYLEKFTHIYSLLFHISAVVVFILCITFEYLQIIVKPASIFLFLYFVSF